jgi:hypothetical protein
VTAAAAGVAGAGGALEPLDRDVWVATRPLRMWIGDIGCRMTVLRLAGGDLLLHSPVPLDVPTREAVDALGRVRWIASPSKVHHLHLGDWARAYPEAELCGVPGVAEKRRDLRFHRVLDAGTAAELWGPEIRAELFGGAPIMNELVLLHVASRTLVLTDLAFNVRSRNEARLFHRLVGATGRFGPHRVARAGIRDRTAARASLETILAWDFDRVVVSHGDVLESGGRAAMEESFSFLLRRGSAH